MPRAPRQRATHNIDMAIEPEEGRKLAHERLQSALPVRAKTRRQTTTPGGTPGPLCQSGPGRRQTAKKNGRLATVRKEWLVSGAITL